jgi:hypothetical protein
MRAKISLLVMIALLFLGMNGNALAANSFNFLGESIWTTTITETEKGLINPNVPPYTPYPTLTITGAISKLGSNYYLFQGVVQVEGDNPFFLGGAGTLVTLPDQTQKLVLTLNTSQRHVIPPPPNQTMYSRDAGVMHVEINPADLSGTFYEVGHDYVNNGGFSQRFSAGTLTRTGPMIPLTSSLAAPMSLLLLDK